MTTSTDRLHFSKYITRPLLFLTLLCAAFLALTIGIAFLKPCALTPYYPYLAIGATLLSARFKSIGISVAYGALAFCLIYFYPSIDPQIRFWEMGLVFTTALTSFIFLLSFEEVEAYSSQVTKNIEDQNTQLSGAKQELKEKEEAYKEQCATLEAELKKLKEEAQARLLERQQDKRNLELLTSEIELLTNQKEEILSSAPHPQLNEATSSQVDPDLKRELSKVEGLYKQLRAQFDEKAKVLLATRKQLFKVEGELEALEREKMLKSLDHKRNLEKDFIELGQENQILEEEITSLEEIISKLMDES